ncbi:MAG: 2-isopropylmalate synthase [Cyanobacteria bacterium SW_11_48_12]|nr:MAG: 2-isopropylmalate synthase [Cyanobacteria bacterium SW_11_48_12]
MNTQPDRIIIFDTTLRDGEQSPGATLNMDEKLTIARQLARLGVDVIEAGFPCSSQGDFEAVRQIAETVGVEGGPTICGLARAKKADIETAAEALKSAASARIHVFLSTSDIHLEYQLKKSKSEVLDMAEEMVAHAKSFLDNIEFSPMDASRSDSEFLYQVIERAIAAGATTVNIPDTVGYNTPQEMGALISGIRENVPNINQAIISVHTQNDLGLATPNALAALESGARQVECTINGIGERAGNAALEELVMALHVRRQYFNPFLGRSRESEEPLTRIDTREIYKSSRLVSNLSGMMVQPNKAIVGTNAFAHESGIHQDGVLKNRQTYEIMDATSIGWPNNLNKAFLRFKELADKKKEITDWDLEAILSDEIQQAPELFRLELVQVSCGDSARPTATVTLRTPEGEELSDAAIGTGPVDAVYQAINRVVNVPNQLIEFSVKSVTAGIDAIGEVTIRLRHEDRVYSGHAAHTDIIVASARAYVNALNHLSATLRQGNQASNLSAHQQN